MAVPPELAALRVMGFAALYPSYKGVWAYSQEGPISDRPFFWKRGRKPYLRLTLHF